jgi:hypothetical protein
MKETKNGLFEKINRIGKYIVQLTKRKRKPELIKLEMITI